MACALPTMSAATHGAKPHSKPPLLTRLLAGVGVHVGVADVVELDNVELIGGLQEHAELYRAGAVPQAADALLGKPVVTVLTVAVYVAQKAASDE